MKWKLPKNQISSTLPKGVKLVFVYEKGNMYTYSYWKGDSEGHAKAGRLGGLKQSWKTNKANFKNDPERARKAGKKSKKK